jgi:type IV secretory pathway TraG/TraD family ATPase VirD4
LDEDRTMSSQPQQDGVFGFARSMMSSLLIPRALRWVAPDIDAHGKSVDDRPRFSPRDFVTTTDTLYLHSEKGNYATPLVAALTQAVLDAGRHRAHQLRSGRLDPPLLLVLDEAANICPLRTLPDGYSTCGGFGIPAITVLQSFEQGIEAWGPAGMKKLWDASTMRLYVGGSGDPHFLDTLSKLLGPRDRTVTATSTNGQGRTSTSYNTRRDNLADVADLSALPEGRALLFSTKARPTLLRTRPWWDTKHAPAIEASIEAHTEPGPDDEAD